MKRRLEFASYIVGTMMIDKPTVTYGNVLNTGLIDNLPQDGVVEAACLWIGRAYSQHTSAPSPRIWRF